MCFGKMNETIGLKLPDSLQPALADKRTLGGASL